MTVDRHARGVDWEVADTYGKVPTWDRVQVAVLMDIRNELRALNATLRCPAFQSIPRVLEQIRRKVPARRRRPRRATR